MPKLYPCVFYFDYDQAIRDQHKMHRRIINPTYIDSYSSYPLIYKPTWLHRLFLNKHLMAYIYSLNGCLIICYSLSDLYFSYQLSQLVQIRITYLTFGCHMKIHAKITTLGSCDYDQANYGLA